MVTTHAVSNCQESSHLLFFFTRQRHRFLFSTHQRDRFSFSPGCRRRRGESRF
jgi:hypothetical protein